MCSDISNEATACEVVSGKSANPVGPDELRQLCNEPGLLGLMRVCVSLPVETRALLEQYLNGCFLESVTARIEPDGALKLDTVNDADMPGAPCELFSHPAERSEPVRRLMLAIRRSAR